MGKEEGGGGGGVKKPRKIADVVYGRPLSLLVALSGNAG